MSEFKFKDTWKFREAAAHFEKHGTYTKHIKGTHSWKEFWKEEHNRCLNGYTVGNVRISGYHYFYLNYCPIMKVEAVNKDNNVTKRQAAERKASFPKFWDVDWMYFTSLDIAEYGIEGDTLEEKIENYRKLPIDLNISLTEENLSGGKHFLWLKPRGVGASFKGASLPARNFFFIKNSKSFMFADNKEFIGKDGIYDKFLVYKNFVNLNTPFFKYTDVVNDKAKMHIRASHKDLQGNEKGYLSEVMGVLIGGDSDKVRGKRGKVTLFEEFGAFVNASDCWEVSKSSHEEGFLVFGTMVAMGTGGTEGVAFEAMEKMMFNPEASGLLEFINIYDEDLIGTKIAFFTPAYLAIAFSDSDGNTDTVKAKEFYEKERAKKLKSPDPNDVAKAKAEHPFTPREALLRTSTNIFPKAELLSWKTELLATKKFINLAVYGNLEDTTKGVVFKPNQNAIPVNKYPHDRKDNNEGCVTMWESPYKKDGVIPDNLYLVCVDPYVHDSTSGDSLGAIYVIKNINPYNKPDDKIVANFVGRSSTIDTFNKVVRQLAQYYNAKIGFENNAGQALLAYFKANRYLQLLAPEFSLAFNENIPSSNVRRGYGMHIDKRRKEIGLGYLADWLTQVWMITEDDEILYNYHKIYDIGLLEEFIKFNPDGNFDRISALIVGIYFQKEIEFKYGKSFAKKELPSFFTNTLFQ